MSKLELIKLRIDVLRLQENHIEVLCSDHPDKNPVEKKYYEFLGVLDRAIKDIMERELRAKKR